ncbi:MAG: hypothetical protein RLO17_13700 [Cyclobacteriaceae bacterium]
MKTYLLILFLSISLGCKSIPTNVGKDSSAVEIVSKFYSWYINEAYQKSTSYYQVPGYKKVDVSKYIFNVDEYKDRLEDIYWFSDNYKEKLINQLKVCNEELMRFDWDAEPEPMFNLKPCNYLWGNQWVGGQGEKIDGFEIVLSERERELVICNVNILIDNNVFVRSIVTLKEYNDEFQIIDISLDWKRD